MNQIQFLPSHNQYMDINVNLIIITRTINRQTAETKVIQTNKTEITYIIITKYILSLIIKWFMSESNRWRKDTQREKKATKNTQE